MSPKSTYNTIIIGAGQGGMQLARAFAAKGKKTALIERQAVGGTCVNYGCTPTKRLVGIARVAQTVRRAGEYGVRAGAPVVDMPRVRELKRAIVEDFRTGNEESLKATPNLDLIYGHASFTSPNQITVSRAGAEPLELVAETIVLNTGTRPFIPPIDGLDSAPYLDNRTIMELDRVPDSLLILGGGYIGLEFGQIFSRLGSRVTVIEKGNRFLPREDQDIAEEIRKILSEEGLEILTGSGANRVSSRDGRIEVALEDGRVLVGDKLLVAVGRTPNTDDLGLAAASVEVDAHGFIRVDDHLRTSVPGIFAMGDAKGGPAFTHISYDDYRILAVNLQNGESRSIASRPVPYCMFTDPQLGRIGLSEDEARSKGVEYRLCRIEMTHVARALEMDESRGFVKALVSTETNLILGAAVLGVEGGEIMAMIQLAMMGGLTASQLANAVFAHPTLAELLNNLFGES